MEKDIITESFLLVSEKNLRIEKRSLEQLQKRGASPNVIAEQQKVVSELTEKYEEAKAATERIQKQRRKEPECSHIPRFPLPERKDMPL